MIDGLCRDGSIINTGSDARPLYIHHDYFDPEAFVRARFDAVLGSSHNTLASSAQLKKGLKGIYLQHFGSVLQQLIASGELRQLKWGRNKLYAKSSSNTDDLAAVEITETSLQQAYRVVVDAKGYADVLINDVLCELKDAKLDSLIGLLSIACTESRAVASRGDWSLSSEAERAAALYINNQPHLRIRLVDKPHGTSA